MKGCQGQYKKIQNQGTFLVVEKEIWLIRAKTKEAGMGCMFVPPKFICCSPSPHYDGLWK